jgi:hypothetical protein
MSRWNGRRGDSSTRWQKAAVLRSDVSAFGDYIRIVFGETDAPLAFKRGGTVAAATAKRVGKSRGFYGLMFAHSAIIFASSSEKPIHLWLKRGGTRCPQRVDECLRIRMH